MTASLDDLAIFVAVARASGVSGAAASLRIPKSSVSRGLARLEASLGVELVHRTTRRCRLSTAGEALLAQTESLVSSLGDALSDVPDTDPRPSGVLRVTSTTDFGATVLAAVVARFVERHPGVVVETHLSNDMVDLVAGGIDLAVRFSRRRRLADSALVATRAGALRTELVASPRYLARRGTPRSPRELAGHEWITYSGAESVVLEAPEGSERVAAGGRIRCDDMFFAQAAARAGGGITLLPSFLAESDLAAGALVRVLPKWRLPSGVVWLVHPAMRTLPSKITAFRDLLMETLASP
ncbi:MAG TPA: LysR substrate-binding domain-containing protein [Polyangiaceae bacterium]|jgi:DNA-binding transcriptional LysR family regulator|nr:LysR substrate-binding domain-containing protein [Polyangiaceae bacterium]